MSFLHFIDTSLATYTGPYAVGTVDVEIPTSNLPNVHPEPKKSVSTISYKIFYPAEKPSKQTKPVRWLPQPQTSVLAAYARFLGRGRYAANLVASLAQYLYYITIPTYRNAKLLHPPHSTGRWPVMIFSHGLGGSRNAYSQIVGSIASHGVVVVAMDHRDGSSPIQHVRNEGMGQSTVVEYKNYPHEPSEEVFKGRDDMLRIRLWETCLVHEAMLSIDKGDEIKNLDPNSASWKKNDRVDVLHMFKNRLNVHEPGAMAWAGHSFGATTMVQLQKSIYYKDVAVSAGHETLMNPSENVGIVRQLVPSSPLVLLDMWTLPLASPATRWLRKKPMPCYTTSGPGGSAILSILSEEFFKWQTNMRYTMQILSPPERSDYSGPRLFYPAKSAHLAQSDFLLLFPRLVKMFLPTEDPVRLIRLNCRAILQHLRDNGTELARTSAVDMDLQHSADDGAAEGEMVQDEKILAKSDSVKGWIVIEHKGSSGYGSDDSFPNLK